MIKRFLSLLFLAALFLQSCSEDLKLAGDFKETAIVYGLLDQADSLHYVKITRAFIGPGNALDIAQIADSSYFDQVDATISEVVNGTVEILVPMIDQFLVKIDLKTLYSNLYAVFSNLFLTACLHALTSTLQLPTA